MNALQPLQTVQRTIVLRPSQVAAPDAVLGSVTLALRTRGHRVRRLGGYRLEFDTGGMSAFRVADDPLLVAGGSVLLDPAGRLHVELRYSPALLGWLFGVAAVAVFLPLSTAARAAILAALGAIVGVNAWRASAAYLGRISEAALTAGPAGAGPRP